MADASILSDLMGVLAERRDHPPVEASYVASLFRGGTAKIGGKIVEEAAEVVEASEEPGEAGREHLVKELADLVFHALVLLTYRNLAWTDVEAELARRFGISGIAEKASRKRESNNES